MWGRRQFDKSLADTLVKQVKTKTTLKVRLKPYYSSRNYSDLSYERWDFHDLGPPENLPTLRRRMDIHSQEPNFQNGVERSGHGVKDQDRCMQKRRCHRGRKEVIARWRRKLECGSRIAYDACSSTRLFPLSFPFPTTRARPWSYYPARLSY